MCGCVCDDLRVRTAGRRVELLGPRCSLADPWFESLNRPAAPAATIDGREVALHAALDRAAAILSASRNPLIFGLSRSSTAGQRAAVALAERIGANVDTTASVCHGPSIMAIQQVGECTSSLGEVRNRADLVIFWGADPATSHPRHFERYSVAAPGRDVPRGRRDRTVVVIDVKETATARLADEFIRIEPGRDFELIWTLRQLIRGGHLADESRPAIPLAVSRRLAERMKSCRYGAVFFGLGLAQSGLGHLNVDALLRLVAELNDHTRFAARRLRIPGDVTGADSVLCWQTGYPFAVNLSRPYPRYNPGEFTANELLARGEVDACLFVGSESAADLSPRARDALARIPTIALDYPHVSPPFAPTVRITTAVYGVHAAGTAYRMDEIPLPLRKLAESEHPTDQAVLGELRRRIGDSASKPS
ncbi:MAG: formylmethanofuran dehydrogenase subunit B [Planctomycetales bacterium]